MSDARINVSTSLRRLDDKDEATVLRSCTDMDECGWMWMGVEEMLIVGVGKSALTIQFIQSHVSPLWRVVTQLTYSSWMSK